MEPREFRKLDIDLPRQPVSNQRSWLIAGWLLAFAILLIAAYAYLDHKKHSVLPDQQKENDFKADRISLWHGNFIRLCIKSL
jgi:hypothetical protein